MTTFPDAGSRRSGVPSCGSLLSVVAAILVLWVAPAHGQELPAPRGWVNDYADILSPETERRLDELAREVRARSGGEIVVVTLPDLGGGSIDDIALRIGRE